MSILVPKSIKNNNDSVNFAYGTKKLGKPKKDICYRVVMGTLNKNKYQCLPVNKESTISYEHFEAFFKMLAENGLCVKDIETIKDKKKNILEFSGIGQNKHLVYSTLCFYRTVDVNPAIPWQVVEHMNAMTGFTFLQALHFSLAFYGTILGGHHVTNVNNYSNFYGYGTGRTDLAAMISLKSFLASNDKNGYTDAGVEELRNKICGTKTVGNKEQAILHIPRFEDLLSQRWTELFTLKNPTVDQLRFLYSKAE